MVLLGGGVFTAQADTFYPDQYWGGRVVNPTPTQYGDQIGAEFGISGVTVGSQGGMTSFKIQGEYFYNRVNNVGNAALPEFGPGDLYLNTNGWVATGTAPYASDTFTQAEGWNLVVTDGGVYQLDYSTIQYSSGPSGWVYRADQAWRGGYGTKIADATVVLDETGMKFTLPSWVLGSGEVGYHHGEGCWNDGVEGQVPLPSTVLLLGSGLTGLALWRKKGKVPWQQEGSQA